MAGMIDLFWELQQQRRIRDTKDSAARAKRRTINVNSEVKELHRSVNKLILINQALWEIIAKTHDLDTKVLIDKVNEIDLRDGTLDRKLKRKVRKCESCGRTLHRGHDKCLYCGSDNFKNLDGICA